MDWSRWIDAGPFSGTGLLDRRVHHNPETLVTLAGALVAQLNVPVGEQDDIDRARAAIERSA